MTVFDHIRDYWRRYVVTTTGLIAIALAAICTHQPNVPVVNSPQFRFISNTEIALTARYAVTTTAGVVEMDAGFICDGASEPPATWSLLGLQPFSGASIRAALVHDALYRGELVSREVADRVFHELLLADGVEPHKARAMFEAVDRAGGVVWQRHTPQSIAAARELVRIR